jgi:hypothetical protein
MKVTRPEDRHLVTLERNLQDLLILGFDLAEEQGSSEVGSI